LRVFLGAVTLRLRRYTIAEESMAPTLMPGDRVLAVRSPRGVRPGDVVVFDLRPGFEVVKRVAPTPGGMVGLWLLGDNPGAGSVDSRSLGAIDPTRITARIEARTHPRPFAPI
jgi:hypothetical protein